MPHKFEVMATKMEGMTLRVTACVDERVVEEPFDAISVAAHPTGAQEVAQYLSHKYCTCDAPWEFEIPAGLKLATPWQELSIWERLRYCLAVLRGKP